MFPVFDLDWKASRIPHNIFDATHCEVFLIFLINLTTQNIHSSVHSVIVNLVKSSHICLRVLNACGDFCQCPVYRSSRPPYMPPCGWFNSHGVSGDAMCQKSSTRSQKGSIQSPELLKWKGRVGGGAHACCCVNYCQSIQGGKIMQNALVGSPFVSLVTGLNNWECWPY